MDAMKVGIDKSALYVLKKGQQFGGLMDSGIEVSLRRLKTFNQLQTPLHSWRLAASLWQGRSLDQLEQGNWYSRCT
jgi:hypothetical protein